MHDTHGHRVDEDSRISMYQTLDQLCRGKVSPLDFTMDVIVLDRKLWCLDNRRLTELKRLQAMSQDKTIWANCVIRTPSQQFWSNKFVEEKILAGTAWVSM